MMITLLDRSVSLLSIDGLTFGKPALQASHNDIYCQGCRKHNCVGKIWGKWQKSQKVTKKCIMQYENNSFKNRRS
jgi:hypothetical protein